jgi:3-mercaptopyruvate sulfurtransferase SseA
VAQKLLEAGWADVRPLTGGFNGWQQAGYPLEAKTKEMRHTFRPAEHHSAADAEGNR